MSDGIMVSILKMYSTRDCVIRQAVSEETPQRRNVNARMQKEKEKPRDRLELVKYIRYYFLQDADLV
jgi:hypothetical protein